MKLFLSLLALVSVAANAQAATQVENREFFFAHGDFSADEIIKANKDLWGEGDVTIVNENDGSVITATGGGGGGRKLAEDGAALRGSEQRELSFMCVGGSYSNCVTIGYGTWYCERYCLTYRHLAAGEAEAKPSPVEKVEQLKAKLDKSEDVSQELKDNISIFST